MTFGAAKDLNASNRFMLVRLEPARHISADLALVSGLYQITYPFAAISQIKRNGAALTEVAVTPTVNDTFHFDEDSRILRIKLASAPSTTTNLIVAFHYLFFTGEKTRYAAETPDVAVSATNPLREWQPRINNYPRIKNSVSNIRAGVLTIADISVEFINADLYFQQHAGENDSFSNKAFSAWQCIDDVYNIAKVYDGKIKDISFSKNNVSISIFDPFTKMQQTGTMTSQRRYGYYDPSLFFAVSEKVRDTPVPLVIGASSRYDVVTQSIWAASIPSKLLMPDSLLKASCLTNDTPAPTIPFFTNRTWGLCRVKGSTLRAQNWGTAVRTTAVSGRRLFFLTGHNLEIGEHVRWTSGTTRYGYIAAAETFSYSGNNYNIVIEDYGIGGASTPPGTVGSYLAVAEPIVYLRQGSTLFPFLIAGLHYTSALVSYPDGQSFVRITFDFGTYSPEGYYSAAPMDTSNSEVLFKIMPNSADTHASILTDICTSAGLTVNTSSFTQADADLVSKVRFQIPFYDETAYSPYLTYAEKVLQSTLGYLKINNNLDVEYHLIAAPTSTDEITEGDYLEGSLSASVDYNDVITEIQGESSHFPRYAAGLDSRVSVYQKQSSAVAQYLHEVENVEVVDHVLDNFSARIAAHASLGASRVATYKLKTATRDMDTEIGDDIKLTDQFVLGSGGTKEMKVISIDKSGTDTTIEMDDLEGI